MAVKWLLKPQLVQIVTDEADGAAQHEQAVEASEGHQVVALLARESAAGADHVDEGHSNATVDVQDEVRALASRQLLHPQSEVQDRGLLEVLLRILLDDFHALIRISE